MPAKPIEGVTKTDLWQVPFSLLRVLPKDAKGSNIRRDYGDIKTLAAQIKANGYIKPFHGWRDAKNGLFFIVDGHRRYDALEYLFKQDKIDRKVPFQIEKPGTTEKDRLLTMFLSSESKELTPMEQSEAVRRFKEDHGMKDADIAVLTGKSGAYISRLSELHSADPEFLEVANKGIIATATAINMLVKGKSEVEEFMTDLRAGIYNDVLEKKGFVSKAKDPELFQVEESEPAKGAKGSGPANVTKVSKQSPITERVIRQKKAQKAVGAGKAAELNSWAELKKFINSYKGKPSTKEGQIVLLFVSKVIKNEAKASYFKTLFK